MPLPSIRPQVNSRNSDVYTDTLREGDGYGGRVLVGESGLGDSQLPEGDKKKKPGKAR